MLWVSTSHKSHCCALLIIINQTILFSETLHWISWHLYHSFDLAAARMLNDRAPASIRLSLTGIKQVLSYLVNRQTVCEQDAK